MSYVDDHLLPREAVTYCSRRMKLRVAVLWSLCLSAGACEQLGDLTRRRIDTPSPWGDWSVAELGAIPGKAVRGADSAYWLNRELSIRDSVAVVGAHVCEWPAATTTMVVDGARLLDSAFRSRPIDFGMTGDFEWYSFQVTSLQCDGDVWQGFMMIWPPGGSPEAYIVIDSLRLGVRRAKADAG